MGQCCTIADQSAFKNEAGGEQTEQYGGNNTNHNLNKGVDEENDLKNQYADAQKVEIKEQTLDQEKAEDKENQKVLEDYHFKKQLETIKSAIQKAEDVKVISEYNEKLANAISQLEYVIYTLSQSVRLPSNIANVKSDLLLGLYGDLQNYRSFHIRYSIDPKFTNCEGIEELSNFFKGMIKNFTNAGVIDYEAFLTNLTKDEGYKQFQGIIKKVEYIRDVHNTRLSGINMSTLPNYLYLIFNDQPGFKLWQNLFPNEFEVSTDHFSEVYSKFCNVSKEKIYNIISLLDNSNDQRVDIYQWIDFVKDNSAVLEKDTSKILSGKLDAFESDIEKKTNTMKKPPKRVGENAQIYILPSGMEYKGTLDEKQRRQGSGELKDEQEGYKFQGIYKDDLPNGQGIEVRKKVEYDGNFKNGLYHGYGKLTFPNGRKYDGLFENHFFHGQGVLTNEDGVQYEGKWEKNILSSGTVTYPDGSKYEGELKKNYFKNGKGTYKSADQSLIYDAYWQDDTPSSAKISFNKKLIYEGPMTNYIITGIGKRIYHDGEYEGSLQRDKKHGDGTLLYNSGAKYQGQWSEDLQIEGTYFYSSSSIHFYKGKWKDGIQEGHGTFQYASGGVYEGDVKEGKREGQGTYKYSNGNKYIGQWIDNNQEGKGKFIFAGDGQEDGDVYEGQFKKGKFSGFGHYTYKKSGKQYIGYWENDKWNGHGKFLDQDNKVLKCGQWKEDQFEKDIPEDQIQFPSNQK